MKRNVMLAGLIMISTIIFAQHRQANPETIATKQTDRIKSVLTLDDAQYASIKNINKKYAEQRLELRGNSSLSKEARHEKVKTLHTEREAEIKNVLTPDQQTKWSEHKSEQSEKWKQRHGTRLKETLSLSDEQVTKMQTINKQFAEQRGKIKNDSGLSEESKKSELKKLRAEHEAQVKSVLSDEQYQKWQTLKTEHRKKKGQHPKKRK